MGFIGASKHPNITHQIATKLFERSEIRGSDASGFWGTCPGEKGVVVYHKEPRKATQFVHCDQWKRLRALCPNVLIMHARASSQGMGDASANKNNHPFVNEDRSVGLVHNGRIFEYGSLKKRYETKSDCDSEILLRLFETARGTADDTLEKEVPDAEPDLARTVVAVREIFAYVNDGHMAVAIGERHDGSRRDLWLFHNKERPLWIADCRDILGQIFFFSTPEIWRDAIRDCPQAMAMVGGRKHKIVPVPEDEIWYFSIDDEKPTIIDRSGYRRFKVDGENHYTPWDDNGPHFPISQPARQIQVVSDLGENDELAGSISLPIVGNRRNKKNKGRVRDWEENREDRHAPKVKWGKTPRYNDQESDINDADLNEYNRDLPEDEEDDADLRSERDYNGWEDSSGRTVTVEQHIGRMIERVDVGYNDNSQNEYNRFDVGGLERIIKDLRKSAADIETTLLNMAQEGSITAQMFQDNVESLEMILHDLKGNQVMLENL